MEELDTSLDASSFEGSLILYHNEFKELMLNIYACYKYMLCDCVKVPSNNENKIRDILLNYIGNTYVRNKVCNIYGYRFDKEVDENKGRVDIKIIPINDFECFDALMLIM